MDRVMSLGNHLWMQKFIRTVGTSFGFTLPDFFHTCPGNVLGGSENSIAALIGNFDNGKYYFTLCYIIKVDLVACKLDAATTATRESNHNMEEIELDAATTATRESDDNMEGIELDAATTPTRKSNDKFEGINLQCKKCNFVIDCSTELRDACALLSLSRG